jgi:hypothetical protein
MRGLTTTSRTSIGSDRDCQKRPELGYGQWCRGKSFDTFARLGPVLGSAAELPDPPGPGDQHRPQRRAGAGRPHQRHDPFGGRDHCLPQRQHHPAVRHRDPRLHPRGRGHGRQSASALPERRERPDGDFHVRLCSSCRSERSLPGRRAKAAKPSASARLARALRSSSGSRRRGVRGWLASRSLLPGGIKQLQGEQEGGHLGMAQRIALDLEAIRPVLEEPSDASQTHGGP